MRKSARNVLFAALVLCAMAACTLSKTENSGAPTGADGGLLVPDAATADSGGMTIDSGSTCPAMRTMCGGECVDTVTDPVNCGSCGTMCMSGKCASSNCTGGGPVDSGQLPDTAPVDAGAVDTGRAADSSVSDSAVTDGAVVEE